MDNANDLKFYIVANKERKGPFSIDELKSMNITSKTKVWCKGMANWENAESVSYLKDIFSNEKTASVKAVANTAPPIAEQTSVTQPSPQPEQSTLEPKPAPAPATQPNTQATPTTKEPIAKPEKGGGGNTLLITASAVFLSIVVISSAIAIFSSNEDESNEPVTLDYITEEEVIPQDPIGRLESDMVAIDGGTLMLGATSEQVAYAMNQEFPAHEVTLSSYQIGRYEVTQEQWEAVMGYNPSRNIGAKMPVENVSWNECQSFLQALNAKTGKNYRLPTEAEWEFAARGGNQSHYYIYSGSDDADAVAWHKGNSGGTTHDVGTKQANELGLYDMSGNVFEWCNDKYGYYGYGAEYNPQGYGTSSKVRVGHGGGYNLGTKFCRVSNRTQGTTNYKSESLGFRIAHD